MTNKVTSTPLFGSPTVGQVKDVQKEIEAYTAHLVTDVTEAKRIFERARSAGGEADGASTTA
jgi:hypothetical protein